MTSCAPSIVERYRDNILWFRPQLTKVRPFPFTANVGSGPEGEVNGCPLAHQLSGVKLTNHEEDADQPFLRINEVARTVGA